MRRLLVGCYTTGALLGSIVSIKREVPARPFGIGTGLPVGADVGLGFGSGLAAPWPIVVMLWWSGMSDASSKRQVNQVLYALLLIGALSEVVTYRAIAGRASRLERVVASVNVLVPILLLAITLGSDTRTS